MNALSCCFTGHRQLPAASLPQIRIQLENAIEIAIKFGVQNFWAGGALGFDTLAAISVLRLRQIYPKIRLILAFPCPEQTRGWTKKAVMLYRTIEKQADQTILVSPHYFTGCMQKRNRLLVENSQLCICYLLPNSSGGTRYTVDLCHKRRVPVLNLAESAGLLPKI